MNRRRWPIIDSRRLQSLNVSVGVQRGLLADDLINNQIRHSNSNYISSTTLTPIRTQAAEALEEKKMNPADRLLMDFIYGDKQP